MSSVIVGTILMVAMTASMGAVVVATLHVPGTNCRDAHDSAVAGGTRVTLRRCTRDPCASLAKEYYTACKPAPEPAEPERRNVNITVAPNREGGIER